MNDTKTVTYGIDQYLNGRWQVAGSITGTYEDAVAAAEYLGTHAHVWWNGDCIYDTRPDEPEPDNGEPLGTCTECGNVLMGSERRGEVCNPCLDKRNRTATSRGYDPDQTVYELALQRANAQHIAVDGIALGLGIAANSIREVDGVSYLFDLQLMERDGNRFFAVTATPLGLYRTSLEANPIEQFYTTAHDQLTDSFDGAAKLLSTIFWTRAYQQQQAIDAVASRFAEVK